MTLKTLLLLLIPITGFATHDCGIVHNVSEYDAFTIEEKDSDKYPQDYFRSPVDYTIRLSGTFGELRPNHFHAGIDIKSPDGKTGAPLYAVADAVVSRVKVQSAGYGNALYLRHPNGYTSVYAHLKKFPPAIAAYVKKQQYKKKSFTIDLHPNADQFQIKKGEVIGWLGLSGRSYGPHLHFEIRDSKTEKPINPQLFGIGAADSKDPKLHALRVYSLNDRLETLDAKNYTLVQHGSTYKLKDTLRVGAWRAGLALKAYDHSDGVTNWNGIYSLDVKQDGQKIYGFKLESFAFSESRYINAHIDYQQQQEKKSFFHRCFTLPGNRLSLYTDLVDKGIITLYRHKPSQIEMIVKDAAGNTVTLEFWIRRKAVDDSLRPGYQYNFAYNSENTQSGEGWKINMSKGCLYEDLYWSMETKATPANAYAPLYKFHKPTVPIHRYFHIQVKPTSLPEDLKSKAFVAHINKDGKISSSGGKWEGDYLKARVRSLGSYTVMIDQKAPKIVPIKFQRDLTKSKKMTFKVTDDADAQAEINSFNYTATVDGNWILMAYDAKNNLLTHEFDERIGKGEHELIIEVTDAVGNRKEYRKTFIR